ncbi:MAG: epoxyqueuosine reductase QueH [Clostridiales bacterium]|nr:epoxyqueuosine reductase QueH [Clostridiales bacterium]
MNKINYQKILDKLIEQIKDKEEAPSLLLHSCCAPCSSYVLEYLSNYFNITIFFYNPNISYKEEYELRIEEQKRLISSLEVKYPIKFMVGNYEPELFYNIAKGYENVPEGGERCFRCYELRLEESARVAKDNNFDYFTTTLSISPLKNSTKLNEIGESLSKKYDIPYLFSDFKKKNGYKRSIELSKEHNLYRQDYCGCIYSKLERERANKEREENN